MQCIHIRKHSITAATFFFWSIRLTFKIHFILKYGDVKESDFLVVSYGRKCTHLFHWHAIGRSLPLEAFARPWDEAGRDHSRLGTASRRRAGQRKDTGFFHKSGFAQLWVSSCDNWSHIFLFLSLFVFFSVDLKRWMNEWIVSENLGCQKLNIYSGFAYLYNKFDHLTYASVGA